MPKTKDEIAAQKREYYLSHKQELNARREDWRKAHPEEWNARTRQYRAKHAEKVRANAREYYATNRDRVLTRLKGRRDEIRSEMIAAYGGQCACCGESNPRFLTIDHVNGGGTRERRTLGWCGNRMASDLKQRGWPKDGYQLLCFNCNCGRAYNHGVCPHVDNSFAWG